MRLMIAVIIELKKCSCDGEGVEHEWIEAILWNIILNGV